jgi:hypothetical protein
MPRYHVTFGAYVRMYADHFIDADNDDAARTRAIEDFKSHRQEFQWLDPNYDNLALPSIVTIQSDDAQEDILQGYDFSATPEDARQYAAHKMLEALEFVRMTFADIEASKRKGYYTQCPKIVAEAIAAATLIKQPA